jgi:hypothetical protein
MDERLLPFQLVGVGIEEAAEEEEAKVKRTGSGAYGYVFKVSVGGVQRIAKKLHSDFVQPGSVYPSKFRD